LAKLFAYFDESALFQPYSPSALSAASGIIDHPALLCNGTPKRVCFTMFIVHSEEAHYFAGNEEDNIITKHLIFLNKTAT
jgi:hypothetical protein